MCFGSKSKAKASSNGEDLNSRPVESKTTSSTPNKMSSNEYSPPPGPPPSNRTNNFEGYAPPQGPPPSHHQSSAPPNASEEYAPPPGPPPSQAEYAPPPGPPPGKGQLHDWQTAVPDTSLLPPPPSLGNQRSTANNATEREAMLGKVWCEQNPLTAPIQFPQAALEALDQGDFAVIKPRSYTGDLERSRPGIWTGKTKSNSPDSCITSAIPLYSVYAHSPLHTENVKTIYYEVKIARRNRNEVSLALGYAAAPYPTFRLPGWHRGCMAVHGDDGSKYINDMWGGKSFTAPFRPGQTVGIGMVFKKRDTNAPPAYDRARTTATTPVNVEIFCTRDGKRDGGWNLGEEGDAEEDLPVAGLEGLNDLYAAIGTFENVEFEIMFGKSLWLYRP